MGDGCCTDFARGILVVFNIILVFSGIGIFGAGMWLKGNPHSVNTQKLISVDNFDETISSTAYVLIGFGCSVVLVGFLGCIGVWKQWKLALGLYIVLLMFIIIGIFSGGIMAAVYRSQLTSELLQKSIAEYKNSSMIREAWDEVQKTLHCCGVTTYLDYSKYAHFSNRRLIILHAQFRQDTLKNQEARPIISTKRVV
uniref:Tetraspanin n=1 Tax=Crassostrea virginica TaxID=6565 RepID=A0A8B8BFZ2_CRAVI|nr:CD82 antigen-like isoform X2 [Crassostrea virginica]